MTSRSNVLGVRSSTSEFWGQGGDTTQPLTEFNVLMVDLVGSIFLDYYLKDIGKGHGNRGGNGGAVAFFLLTKNQDLGD